MHMFSLELSYHSFHFQQKSLWRRNQRANSFGTGEQISPCIFWGEQLLGIKSEDSKECDAAAETKSVLLLMFFVCLILFLVQFFFQSCFFFFFLTQISNQNLSVEFLQASVLLRETNVFNSSIKSPQMQKRERKYSKMLGLQLKCKRPSSSFVIRPELRYPSSQYS